MKLGKLPVANKKFHFLVVASEVMYALQMTTVLGCCHHGCIDIYELWMFVDFEADCTVTAHGIDSCITNIFLTFA